MKFVKCSACEEARHKSWYSKSMLHLASQGYKARCRTCDTKQRVEARWIKNKTVFPIRWKPTRVLYSVAGKMNLVQRRAMHLEAIRCVFRVWCKTGRLIAYRETVSWGKDMGFV